MKELLRSEFEERNKDCIANKKVKTLLKIIDSLTYVMKTQEDLSAITGKREEMFICNNIVYYTNELLYCKDSNKRMILFISELINSLGVLNYFYDLHSYTASNMRIRIDLLKYVLLDEFKVVQLSDNQKNFIDYALTYDDIYLVGYDRIEFNRLFNEELTIFSARKLGYMLDNLLEGNDCTDYKIICHSDSYIKFRINMNFVHIFYYKYYDNGMLSFDGNTKDFIFYYDIKAKALIPNHSNRIKEIKEVEDVYTSLEDTEGAV